MKFIKEEGLENGSILMSLMEEVENVDPVNYYYNYFISSIKLKLVELLNLQLSISNSSLPQNVIDKVCEKNATDWSHDKITSILKQSTPPLINKLLNAKKKKDQIKILKKLKLTPDDLLKYLFVASEEHQYVFSQYFSEYYSANTDVNELPQLFYLKNGKIIKKGKTSYSDKRLISILKQRRKLVIKFIDKGDDWQCFFLSFNSLMGQESWKDGAPHFHFISSKFGLTREKVLKNLKAKKYKLGTMPHIELTGYIESQRKNYL